MKKRNIKNFFNNENAVLGLPLRLTVSLIIGGVVLLTILSFILNPCLFPHRMLVSVTPLLTSVHSSGPENVTFIVFVNDTDGHPLSGASVIIEGLGGAGSGFSDTYGKTVVQIQVQLEDGVYEDYLDIAVKAACQEPFEHQDIIKVVKSTI